MVNIYYIYCFWVWIFSLLFYFNIINYSTLFSLILGFIFTFYHNIFYYKSSDLQGRIFIIIFEFVILFLVYKKSKKLDILYNLFLFLVYNIFLKLNNKNITNLYFNELNDKQHVSIYQKITKLIKKLSIN